MLVVSCILDALCFDSAGMLLRLFMYMYDLDVIDEGAYFRWKEEVNDEYPGKGKALFQVSVLIHKGAASGVGQSTQASSVVLLPSDSL